MKFRDLNIGDSFDWINDASIYNSFFLRCVKISTRKYRDERGTEHRVGNVSAPVYHVETAAR